MTSIADFYDDYVDRQVAAGINERHQSILRFLARFGLLPHHRVLELGAGIGTLTGLLAERLTPNGSLVAIDLSPRSIVVAKERLARFTNVEFVVGDALEIELARQFDVVVLPDVIEHIPLELHPAVFRRVSEWLTDDGFAFVHYPNPHHLQWLAEHRPHILQVVDQPVHANVLLTNAYAAGLYLDYYERYSIWVREGDYVAAVLKPSAGVRDFVDLPEPRPSFAQRALRRGRRVGRLLVERTRRRGLASQDEAESER
jgi:2-polyprenyl-3-methyl-5-hydroxy-6-metoxy-1,4-benzoquinol methylase